MSSVSGTMDLSASAAVVALLRWPHLILPPVSSSTCPPLIYPSSPTPHPSPPHFCVPGWPLSPSYKMAGEKGPTKRSAMDIKRLASLIQRGTGRLLVIDSRTFSEYNASHVQGAVNVCCSKLVKRRLQQDKVSVTELLQPNGKVKVSSSSDLTVDAFWVVGCDASD